MTNQSSEFWYIFTKRDDGGKVWTEGGLSLVVKQEKEVLENGPLFIAVKAPNHTQRFLNALNVQPMSNLVTRQRE